MEKEILEALLRIEKLLLKEKSIPVIERRTPFPWGLMPARARKAIKRASICGHIKKELPLSCEDLIELGRETVLSFKHMGDVTMYSIDEAMIDCGFPEWMAT